MPLMNDVIIIGCGPATYMAAIYTYTANISTLIIEDVLPNSFEFLGHDKVAGLLNINSPKDLTCLMQQQVTNFGVKRVNTSVRKATIEDCIKIETDRGHFESRCVIIDGQDLLEKNFENSTSLEDMEKIGIFACGKIKGGCHEAVFLIASGCQAAFGAKDFLDQ